MQQAGCRPSFGIWLVGEVSSECDGSTSSDYRSLVIDEAGSVLEAPTA